MRFCPLTEDERKIPLRHPIGLYCWIMVRNCEHGTLARMGISKVLQELKVGHVVSLFPRTQATN